MSMTEEEQVQAMLDTMGVSSVEEVASTVTSPPVAAAPIPEPTPAPAEPDAPIAPVAPVAAVAAKPSTPEIDMSSMLASVANTERRASAVIGSRDVPVSTVVHLMGLPTASQLSLLEGKIDVLTSKIGTITAKIERLSSEVSLLKSDATIDRIDFQLNDLRGLLRRLVPKATAAGEIETAPEAAKAATAPKPKVLSSAPAAKPKAASEPDALEEFDNDAGAFQAAEGRRVRQETK